MQYFLENDFRSSYKLQKFADKAIEKLNLKFPLELNSDLAKIVSFLTFDGHLTPNNKMFIFTAGTTDKLNDIITAAERQFGVKGKTRKVETNTFGTSYEYRICCKPIGKILEMLGVPTGNKVLKKFDVPIWILQNKEFSFHYLKTAFECEGSLWKENKRVQIAFRIHKHEKLINNGQKFLDTIRKMLLSYKIETTKVWIVKGNKRKDGNITVGMQFRIKSKSIGDFSSLFGFRK
ncbi:MAG: hypothetical protein HYU56_03085 [Candidatus Aenigmarchaeota archaeon]|nr:hypothetical protein [Candidatus Aenigmarchaeota archaeon]